MRSPAARRGGAPVDPEHWSLLGKNWWCWEIEGGVVKLLMLLERLGGSYL